MQFNEEREHRAVKVAYDHEDCRIMKVAESHMVWIVPALVALLAFGGQFAASIWTAGGKAEKYDSIALRVSEMERRLDLVVSAEAARDLMQARLEERMTSMVQDISRVHGDIGETNRHLTAIEDFLYRKGGESKASK
jgi:hypothetical protein